MSQIDKLITKFTINPTSLKYIEIKKILLYHGFIKKQGKGSHVYFKNINHKMVLCFPLHNNDCKNIYKEKTLKKIIHIIS
jgi:predicted RNA binding protein YcfA (HicA-like mRNA interferase family)